jgi:stage V sporulation protein G
LGKPAGSWSWKGIGYRLTGGIVEITKIRLTIRNEERLKAFANVTFDDSFVIHGLKIINGDRGMFISMPSRRRPDGSYQDVAHPINSEMRRHLERVILDAYENEIRLIEEQDGSLVN